MLKRCIVLFWLVCLLTPTGIRAGEGGLVINRFQISGSSGSNDEFVELYNPGETDVDVSNWKLAKKSASLSASSSYLRTYIPEGTVVGSRQKLIIAHPSCACTSDLLYATSTGSVPSGIASDNTIILFNEDRDVIDKVGFGKAQDVEIAPISASPGVSEIYARKNNGQDTDNNRDDFYLAYSPPKAEAPDGDNENSPKADNNTSQATVGAKIRVNEFMINPEGSDADGEWIEIYNAGGDANITGYIVADKVGSPKKYTFPKGTVIKAKQYLAFYSGQTPISLNNDGDAVEVRSPDGAVISTSGNSGKGPEGASFAFDGSKWVWTAKPTPGRANIIEAIQEGAGDKDGKNKEILGLVDESQLPTEAQINKSQTAKENDRLMGYGLIVLAILGAISYTLSINKEKLREFYYNKVRKRDHLTGAELRQKLKGR